MLGAHNIWKTPPQTLFWVMTNRASLWHLPTFSLSDKHCYPLGLYFKESSSQLDFVGNTLSAREIKIGGLYFEQLRDWFDEMNRDLKVLHLISANWKDILYHVNKWPALETLIIEESGPNIPYYFTPKTQRHSAILHYPRFPQLKRLYVRGIKISKKSVLDVLTLEFPQEQLVIKQLLSCPANKNPHLLYTLDFKFKEKDAKKNLKRVLTQLEIQSGESLPQNKKRRRIGTNKKQNIGLLNIAIKT